MDELLRKSISRRPFFVILILLFLLLLVLRFFFKPTWESFALGTIDNLIGTVFAAFFIGVLIVYLLPDLSEAYHLATLTPREIGPLLLDASRESGEWWFRGAMARYLRSVTLPNMVASATEHGLSKRLHILLFDPRNDRLCELYADYRRDLALAREKAYWTQQQVKAEIYATIFEVYRITSHLPLVQVSIGTVDTLSTFRYDLSSQYLLITKEGRKDPAIRTDLGSFFYESFKAELTLQLQQSDLLPDPHDISFRGGQSKEDVRALLSELGFSDGFLDSEESLDLITRLARERVNPFA
jgi:hypothetical protein